MFEQNDSRIFIVDDERVIAETLAAILRSCGYVAIPFTNPLDALIAAKNDPPDLLVSDVMMPDMTGVELAISIKFLCANCKVLLFSGQAQTADLLHSARARGHDFQLLTKPVHPSELLHRIKQQLDVQKGSLQLDPVASSSSL